MLKKAKIYLFMLSLLVAAGQGAASAQIGDTTIEADIPYAFTVENTTLPAGKYAIRALDDTDQSSFEIQSADGRTAAIFETHSAEANPAPRQTELVFNKIGDRYFLSQIWLEGSNSGNELEKPKAEKQLEASGIASEHPAVVAKHSMGTKGNAAMELTNAKPQQ